METDLIQHFKHRVTAFETMAHQILSTQEASKSRVISLYQSLSKLDDLSLDQDEQFRQALQCVEHGLYKAAYVLSWAGFMDFLEHKLTSEGLTSVHSARPKWARWTSLDMLRENIPEHQLIDVARDVGLLSKADVKALHGDLSRRNECAHPSSFQPGLNESLGYVSGLLRRVEVLLSRTL